MQLITFVDYLLLPVYFIIFLLLALKGGKKQPTPLLRKYYVRSFLLHMFGSILFAMIIQYYYGSGDAFTYYLGGEFIRNAGHETGRTIEFFFMSGKNLFDISQTYELDNIPRYGLQTPATLAMEKTSGLLSFISFHSLIIIGLFMGRFAFLGQWKLFIAFNEILQEKHQKLLAFSVLFIPSVWFWGSGLGKDAICLGALGYLGHATYLIFFKRKFSLRNIGALIVSFTLLLIVKSYIAAAFIAAGGIAFCIAIIQSRSSKVSKFFTGAFLGVIVALLFNFVLLAYVQNMIEESARSIEVFKMEYANSGVLDEQSKGSFDPGDIDISLNGFIAQSPGKLFSTLFRPFVWETRKPIMLFSALESLIMLLGFLYVLFLSRIFGFIRNIWTDAKLMFAFVFCVMLAVIIGFTTFNFGTVVRYRLPLLPFYGFLLISIYTKAKEKR